MVIIFRGFGWLVPVIGLGSMFISGALASAIAGPGDSAQAPGWTLSVGLLLGAVLVWTLGQRFNEAEPQSLLDPTTGEAVLLQREHSLYFVKMQYWAVLMVAAAAAFAFA